MQLSKQEAYALRLALDLVTNAPGPVHEIARRQNIPAPYLAKIAQSMARGGVLRTERGARGGVQLARPAEDITMRQVIEAAQGPIVLSRCLADRQHDCPTNSAACPVRQVTARLQHLVIQELDSISLADMARMGNPDGPDISRQLSLQQ